MKIRFIILYSLIVFVVFSCSRSEKTDQTSPKFNFPTDSIFTSYHDTLHIKGTYSNGFQMDSIAAGDTATFLIDIDGVFHNLTEINISLSVDSVAELLFPDKAYMDSMFLSSSDYEEGTFYVAGNKTRIPFYFSYCADKASKDVTLTLTAHSNANEQNVNNFTLKLPIKKTPAPEFYFPSDTIYTENNDTLKIRIVSSTYRLDAITVGDIADFKLIIYGVRNNLKQFKLTPKNDTDAEIILPDESILDELFLETSDYKNGIFDMDATYPVLEFPFRLHTKQVNDDFSLKFEATSDALYDYGISTFELITPITAIAEEEEEEEEEKEND